MPRKLIITSLTWIKWTNRSWIVNSYDQNLRFDFVTMTRLGTEVDGNGDGWCELNKSLIKFPRMKEWRNIQICQLKNTVSVIDIYLVYYIKINIYSCIPYTRIKNLNLNHVTVFFIWYTIPVYRIRNGCVTIWYPTFIVTVLQIALPILPCEFQNW